MYITSKDELRHHLAILGLAKGDRVCVHSRLLGFGRLEGGVGFVRDALMAAVGPSGTVAVPTFTLNLTADDVYDPVYTPSHAVGPLSEFVRRTPSAIRTLCPLHSFAAIGPAASILTCADPRRSIGPGSAFDVMGRSDFKMLLLGCNFQEGATYIHNLEAMFGVPYRKWITIPRRVRSNGVDSVLDVYYYAKKSDGPRNNSLHDAELAAEQEGVGKFVALEQSGRRSYLVRFAELDEVIRRLIERNPYALVIRE